MTDPAVDAMIDRDQGTTPTPHAAPASWRDPMIRLAAASKALAALAAAQERSAQHRQGRPCDPELIRAGTRYATWVFALVAGGRQGLAPAATGGPTPPEPAAGPDPELLADLDFAARCGTKIPSWRLRRWLRQHGVPAAYIVGRTHVGPWAGVPGSGVIALPGRSTTRSAAQIATEDPWIAARAAVQAANDRTDVGETVRVRSRETGRIEKITPAEALTRRWGGRG